MVVNCKNTIKNGLFFQATTTKTAFASSGGTATRSSGIIEGDLIEVYNERLTALGKRHADRQFIIDVLLLFRPGIITPFAGPRNLTTYSMYKSYFKIGWRNLLKNKGYSVINIGGLALGMTVAMFIGLWIYDELSFNKYHKNCDHIGVCDLKAIDFSRSERTSSGRNPLGNSHILQGFVIRHHVVQGKDVESGECQCFYSANHDLLMSKVINNVRDSMECISCHNIWV